MSTRKTRLLSAKTAPVLAVYTAAIAVAMAMTMQTYRLLSYWRDTAWLAWTSAFVMALFVELAPLAFDIVALEQFGEQPRGVAAIVGKAFYWFIGGAIAVGVTLYLNQVLSQHMAAQWDFAAAAGNWANLVTALAADVADMLLAPGVALLIRQAKQRQEAAAETEARAAKQDAKEADSLAFERARVLAEDEHRRSLQRDRAQWRHEERVSTPSSSDRTVDVQPEQELSRDEKLAAIVDMYASNVHTSKRAIGREVNISPVTAGRWTEELVNSGRLKMTLDGGFTPNGHEHD